MIVEKLILIGAGGYAKSVLDSLDVYNYDMIGFIDEYSQAEYHLGYPVIGHGIIDIKNPDDYVYFISIGNNEKRKKWFEELRLRNLRMINVIDKSAIISLQASIGNGCFVGKLAIINSGASVGDNCIVNTRALMEHGSSLKNHVNLSTNTVINGDVIVDEGSFIGSCSVIIGQLTVGKWSTVGAGAVVIRNVESGVTVAGVPAKVIREGAMLG